MSEQVDRLENVGEIVRQAETDFISGTTQISKYVNHSLNETLERIEAYDYSKHLSGETDSLGREKPFFNISTSAKNIWYRATDLDRKHFKIRATKTSDWLNAILARAHIQQWMRDSRFGVFLNDWGRTLAKYGSAVVKIVESSDDLNISVVPWNTLIVDAVDFDATPPIEIIQLSESQLRRRIETHGYDADKVNDLISEAKQARQTTNKQRKDNLNDFYKLYEIHGEMDEAHLEKEAYQSTNKFTQQMHVISFVGIKKGRKTEYKDFTLYAGREKKHPYMITHLIKEEGRTLAIGAIEYLFESQWMVNHSMKAIKDHLDIASKLIFQTADSQFLGRNVVQNIESGDILIHGINQPLTQVNNSSHDTVQFSNYMQAWKQVGNEIVGISDAMLGAQPKAGTAWRQTEALLTENYSLFELMTENKSLALEDMFRQHIIPHIKRTKLNNKDEITSTLEQYDINRIDPRYLKNKSISTTNSQLKEMILSGQNPTPELQLELQMQNEQSIQEMQREQGNQRGFVPDEIGEKTWKDQLKDLEWELEIDFSGETQDVQEALSTLNTALKLVITPGFEQNPKAQALVGRALELTNVMSPVEYNALPNAQVQPTGGGRSDVGIQLQENAKERNING